ncbi:MULTISPECIES: GNAT family N-acetyltransferase [unclassified Dietzia]|uniref:GNAT family N-acetyltransferase n=4 Tax=Dietzia TaxID=37914 RepID=UPI000D21DE42|nr:MULTISPECIES: GNAT family N-acetyltransferase [unclassified Dietzia]AVZ40416.1 GNAT family N-acetyltransferase [Dietzia sp. JS16-p6b]QGW25922.1 GCN5-related N-acetyltransferase [Dietzia sp. DQ12-45-1b]
MAEQDWGLADRSRWNAGRRVEVGMRVVVRRHLEAGQGSHLYTDVIGHVVALDPELVVRRESGEEVRIPDSDIAVLKVLPPRPVRARDVRAHEWAGALAWPGTDFELVDGWFCRAGDDWSYRGNSAVPVLPWASCSELDGVRDWYAARGLPLRLVAVDRLVDADRMLLDGRPVDPARVRADRELVLCTVDSRELLERVDATVPADARPPVVLADSPDDDWLALYHATAGLDPDRVRPAMLATAGLAGPGSGGTDQGLPGPGGHVVFARVEDDGDLAAIARGAVTTGPDGTPRVAVSCVQTADAHRRRGLAEVVTGALVGWGRSLGAEECHLHVFADNAAGRGLWAKLGLAPHHSMRHLVVVEGSTPRSTRSDAG